MRISDWSSDVCSSDLYGFNKSHAAAYALLSYQTAWLKAHYPHEFFAASMSFDSHKTDKLSIFIDDMRRLDVAIAPPSFNDSEADFSVGRSDTVQIGIASCRERVCQRVDRGGGRVI